jgi:acetate kinase
MSAMRVLALNCGSSSVKFQLIAAERAGAAPTERRLARGVIERIGAGATLTFEAAAAPPLREQTAVTDHAAGIRRITDWIAGAGLGAIDAVGHRVVHGGERFVSPAVIDDDVVNAITALEELAPLHNAPSLDGIRGCRAVFGATIPMVAVFDTAFHARLPDRAARYALADELARKHGIRRFGFHGISYASVTARYCEITRTRPAEARLIALHLGNGASAVAIDGGRSIDTSMGFTPLEGLVMGTRSGDLDPAIVDFVAKRERVSSSEVVGWLNQRSGLLGVSGKSRDVRELLAAERDDPRCRLAIEMFCYRARKYVGAYLAALEGPVPLVFTGGIGEHAPEIRARVCDGLAWCGLVVDPARNDAAIGVEALISRAEAGQPIFVIPTDEEGVIARETAARLG